MKLNLLPTYVSREKTTRRAQLVAVVLLLAGVVLAVLLKSTSEADLARAKQQADELKPQAEKAFLTANQADEVIKQATDYVRNASLAKAMDLHNAAYPDFYDKFKKFLPDFFRIMRVNVSPNDGATVTVRITGVIKNQSQYNNLTLALLKIPQVQSVTRSPIPVNPMIVPNITPGDKAAKPRKQSDGAIPDDPDQRLAYFLAKGGVTGFQNVGGFGTPSLDPRGAMPNYSEVTISLTMPGSLQTPDPRATLAAAGPAPAASSAPAAGAAVPASLPTGPRAGGGGPE